MHAGLINKVNTGNIKNIIPEIFNENLVRARGVVCRSIMKAQMASPTFTHVYGSMKLHSALLPRCPPSPVRLCSISSCPPCLAVYLSDCFAVCLFRGCLIVAIGSIT
jgi:hypothetical protein